MTDKPEVEELPVHFTPEWLAVLRNCGKPLPSHIHKGREYLYPDGSGRLVRGPVPDVGVIKPEPEVA